MAAILEGKTLKLKSYFKAILSITKFNLDNVKMIWITNIKSQMGLYNPMHINFNFKIVMKEIAGIFNDKIALDKAVEQLSKFGINKHDISLLAKEAHIKKKLGNDYSSVLELRDNLNVPRINFISEKSIYSREDIFITSLFYVGLVTAIIITVILHQSISVDLAIAFFAGTTLQIIAMLISGVFRKQHGDYIERKLNKGGLLFWILVDDKISNKEICKILEDCKASNIRIRNI